MHHTLTALTPFSSPPPPPPPRSSGPQAQEISFQQFKTDLLKKELVARLEVANGDMVKVFIKQETGLEGAAPEQAGNYKYYFLIGERLGCWRRHVALAQQHIAVCE